MLVALFVGTHKNMFYYLLELERNNNSCQHSNCAMNTLFDPLIKINTGKPNKKVFSLSQVKKMFFIY